MPGLLVLNSGSSSLKFALFDPPAGGIQPSMRGEVARIGEPRSTTHIAFADGRAPLNETAAVPDHRAALHGVLRALIQARLAAPQVIAHRIVHGGAEVRNHTVIDAAVLTRLREAVHWAPLHATAALAVVELCMARFPSQVHVACLDTAFHAPLPALARTLPLPLALRAAGIERYGFHGLSCASIVHQLAQALPARLVIAHLGQGASITAVLDGRSIDTSMGLTPSGGVMMGTRSGDLDPGVLLHALRVMKLDADTLEDLLVRKSGLLGVSGLSADLRTLRAAAATHGDAQLALDLFGYAVAKAIGAMVVGLGGIDGLVFTGGIGEHDADMRSTICARLSCLGLALDEDANRQGGAAVSLSSSACSIQVLPAREEEQMARHTWALLSPAA